MRYSYSVAIITFAGSKGKGPYRLDCLLNTLDKCPSMQKMEYKKVFEDFCPQVEYHEEYCKVMSKYIGWELVSAKIWGNAQGNAQLAMENSPTDWVFLLEDDQLAVGDPLGSVIDFLETCPTEVAEKIGGIYLTHYQIDDLYKAGIFPNLKDSYPLYHHFVFYNDPFNTWFKDVKKLIDPNPASIGTVAHGQGSCIKRKAWEMTGGYDKRWHAFDQTLSYNIWLHTPYIIVSFPTDPFYHCGGCAQAGDYFGAEAASFYGSSDRCKDIYGISDYDLEVKILNPFINNKIIPEWKPKITKAWEEWSALKK